MENIYEMFDSSTLEKLYQQYCQQPQQQRQQQNNSCHCELSASFDLQCNINHDFKLMAIDEHDLLVEIDDYSEIIVDKTKSDDKNLEKQGIEKWKELIRSYYDHTKQLEQLPKK
ncbi:unnamed protein product [Rotaria sp. Silwood2]|nr:unnamed protein product [Rotaria sp. Silwood2]CAF3045161.1 unnamed protein product [Rotaria sp. Silwood2]CAF3310409.1 unnamed protein product [Rotaria sp. Silwood2]CAF4050220.1 unnamed protein product [Rotaria sp. Silwood2]CAF4295193.1 unnamed protein product [Rotaria sp. Silwood2]